VLAVATPLAQPWAADIPKFAVKLLFTLIALSLLGTACNPSNETLRRRVAGTWIQGMHTLTLDPDGTYTSIFPGEPAITYKARWQIEHGCLVVTNVSSNAVPIAGDTTVQIVLVDSYRLEMALGTNKIWMTR